MWLDKNTQAITIAVMVLAAIVISFNSMQLSQLRDLELAASPVGSGAVTTGNVVSVAAGPNVIPSGVPRLYGPELGVSYSDVSVNNAQLADATIRKLGMLDQQITLSGTDMERYIKIASQISCEYCCGTESIITETGEAACGCAHSYAMRGVAKYLITRHGAEFTDNEILEEMGKWKTLFFPGQISKKAAVLSGQGVQLNYVNLASNKYRGAESQAAAATAGSGSGMVGGC